MVYVHLNHDVLNGVFHTVVVSAQSTCTITPLNPITLTAAGGVLADGTVNVTIQCNCSDDVGAMLQPVRWFNPDGDRMLSTTHRRYVAGSPYFKRAPDDTNVLTIIPIFSSSYYGTYTCGLGNIYPYDGPIGNITLKIDGE